MENLITILNTVYKEKIEPILKENEELKKEKERYRSIAQKAVKERNQLRDICKMRGWVE